MSLTQKDIEEITRLLEASSFDRINLEMDGLKLELVRNGAKAPVTRAPEPEISAAPAAASPPPSKRVSTEEGLVEISSPLLGIFYHAPKPGEPSFVKVGDRVEETTIIGIIEVMKLMNSARAGVSGEIVEIVGVNGEMVEHGEMLMLVRPD